MGAIKFTQQMPVAQFDKLFPTDDTCKQYLVSRRWPNGANCPRCGNENVYPVTNRPFHAVSETPKPPLIATNHRTPKARMKSRNLVPIR